MKQLSVALNHEIHPQSDPKYGIILGIYYQSDLSLGVTFSGPPISHPEILTPDGDCLGNQEMPGISSTVHMEDVQRIDVWFFGKRCLGMMATFQDSRDNILGRWDERSTDFRKETLFDKEYESLAFEAMEISVTKYLYKNKTGTVGDGPITFIDSVVTRTQIC